MRYRKDLIKLVSKNRIKLPKLGLAKYKGNLLDGKIINGTIKMHSFGRVELVICYELEDKVRTSSGVIAIDINCHNITDNNGHKYNIPAYHLQSKIKKWQKVLARRVKGSSKYNKAKVILAKRHYEARMKRRDIAHKISNKIASPSESQARTVILEDINLRALTAKGKGGKRGLNRSLLDSCLGEIRQKLGYKCVATHKIDRFYPSSQLCSSCGYQNRFLKLSDRKWGCVICEAVHDRDINAAKNILNKWLEDSHCGAVLRPPINQYLPIWDYLLTRGYCYETGSSQ